MAIPKLGNVFQTFGMKEIFVICGVGLVAAVGIVSTKLPQAVDQNTLEESSQLAQNNSEIQLNKDTPPYFYTLYEQTQGELVVVGTETFRLQGSNDIANESNGIIDEEVEITEINNKPAYSYTINGNNGNGNGNGNGNSNDNSNGNSNDNGNGNDNSNSSKYINWIGTANSSAGSYLGMVFHGNALPSNSTITSAYVEFTNNTGLSQTQTLNITASFITDETPDTFTNQKAPSARTLTEVKDTFNQQVSFEPNSTFRVDVTSSINNLFESMSPQSKIGIVLQGNGTTENRLFFNNHKSKDSSAETAPRLVIEYGQYLTTIPQSGGSIISGDGNVIVTIPSGTQTEDIILTIAKIPNLHLPAPSNGAYPVTEAYQITAKNSQGVEVKDFSQDIEIAFYYKLDSFTNAQFGEGQLMYFSEASNSWVGVPTFIETNKQMYITHINHLSIFQAYVVELPDNEGLHLPVASDIAPSIEVIEGYVYRKPQDPGNKNSPQEYSMYKNFSVTECFEISDCSTKFPNADKTESHNAIDYAHKDGNSFDVYAGVEGYIYESPVYTGDNGSTSSVIVKTKVRDTIYYIRYSNLDWSTIQNWKDGDKVEVNTKLGHTQEVILEYQIGTSYDTYHSMIDPYDICQETLGTCTAYAYRGNEFVENSDQLSLGANTLWLTDSSDKIVNSL